MRRCAAFVCGTQQVYRQESDLKVSKQTRSGLLAVLLAAMLVIALAVTGCNKPSTKTSIDENQKQMIESVAKWYVAQGKLDVKGYKAGIYDPDNILGVATMTAPPKGAKETTVTYAWSGDNAIISIPGQNATITVSASPTSKTTVLLSSGGGSGSDSIVMTQVAGVWKIDVNATQKAAAAAAASSATSTTP